MFALTKETSIVLVTIVDLIGVGRVMEASQVKLGLSFFLMWRRSNEIVNHQGRAAHKHVVIQSRRGFSTLVELFP